MVSLLRQLALFTTSLRSSALSSKREFSLVLCGSPLIVSASNRFTNPNTKSYCQMDASSSADLSTGYLDAESAYALDQELMSTPGFTLDQLMELAGLAVAQAVHQQARENAAEGDDRPKIVLVCGPGNNGGDGLVAARHLTLFGYECVVVYPKQSSREPHYANLVHQLEDFEIPIKDELELPKSNTTGGKVIVVDAIFGFSFKGEAREPFASMIKGLIRAQQDGRVSIVSVDVPSGWNVDEGDVSGMGLVPDVLISLTAPKLSSKTFKGTHYVGGRFLPPRLAAKYGIRMPEYPATTQAMKVASGDSERGWEQEYFDYLAAKESKDPAQEGRQLGTGGEEWQEQYSQYLKEKGEKEKRSES